MWLEGFPITASARACELMAAGTLPSYPVVDQKNDPEQSGQIDPNGPDDCWAVADSAAVRYLTGAGTGQGVDGGDLNAFVYGADHVGGGDCWDPKCVEWNGAHGCHLDDAQWANDANVGDVLAYVRRQLDLGHPVIMTIPSQWGVEGRDNASGYHAVDVVGYDDSSFTIMNPWGGVLETYGNDWMGSRCVNAGAMWREANVDTSNLGGGFAAYVQAHGITAAQVTPGEVRTGDPRYPGESFATFADGTELYYTQLNGVQANRGPWLVLEFWQEIQARDAAIAKLQQQAQVAAAQVADLQAQLATAQKPVPVDPKLIAEATAFAQMKQIAAQVA